MPEEEVAAQIEAAFADTPPPGNDFDDISATKYGEEGIVDYFRGTTWRGHHVLDLRKHECALAYFTDKAFRYWLPAFMLADLESPEEADIIAEGIAFHLTESDVAEARCHHFSTVELEAIAAFFGECARTCGSEMGEKLFRQAEKAIRERVEKA